MATVAKLRGDRVRGRGAKSRYVKRGGRHEHRVVMEEKLGRRLLPGEIVHHKDENTRNNDPDNLELLPSQSDHAKVHAFGSKGKRWTNGAPHCRGEKAAFAKLTDAQVLEIRARHAKGGVSVSQLGKEYGVTHSNISMIVRRVTWAHI
jgi:hypothetical protein